MNFFKDAFKQFKILASNLGSNHAAALVGKKGGDYIFKDSYKIQPTTQLPEETSCQFGCRFGWWIELKNVSLKLRKVYINIFLKHGNNPKISGYFEKFWKSFFI